MELRRLELAACIAAAWYLPCGIAEAISPKNLKRICETVGSVPGCKIMCEIPHWASMDAFMR
jgi:hypothetical protein